jgi:hypothetical protein
MSASSVLHFKQFHLTSVLVPHGFVLGLGPALTPALDAFSHVVKEFPHHSSRMIIQPIRRLSDHFFLRFGPRRWCEILDLGDFGRRQAGEQISKVIKRVDAISPATAQQSVDHRAAFAGFGMPYEQKILFPESRRANRKVNMGSAWVSSVHVHILSAALSSLCHQQIGDGNRHNLVCCSRTWPARYKLFGPGINAQVQACQGAGAGQFQISHFGNQFATRVLRTKTWANSVFFYAVLVVLVVKKILKSLAFRRLRWNADCQTCISIVRFLRFLAAI